MLQTQPSTQHVFIVGDNTLFEECITQLLTHKTGLQVTSIKYTDELTLLDYITLHQPQVIILNESSLLVPISFFRLLLTTHLMTAVRLIILRNSDSVMDIYNISQQKRIRRPCERRQFTLSKQHDLLMAVKN